MTAAARAAAIAVAALAVTACATAPAPPAPLPLQPACAATVFPPNERIGAWSVDKFAGRYTDDRQFLTVRRDDHRLFVEGSTLGTRELTADDVASWMWHDGCGTRFEFTLPSDGPGGWLKIVATDGRSSSWHR